MDYLRILKENDDVTLFMLWILLHKSENFEECIKIKQVIKQNCIARDFNKDEREAGYLKAKKIYNIC